jgi:hypothetical protein
MKQKKIIAQINFRQTIKVSNIFLTISSECRYAKNWLEKKDTYRLYQDQLKFK